MSIAPGIQYVNSIVPDGSGGAILCWSDGRNGLDNDVFASKLSSLGPVDVPRRGQEPGFRLEAARPKPMRRITVITFAVPARMELSLSIFDVQGRLIRTLFHGTAEPGKRSIRWDGRDEWGRLVPSTLYF